MKKAKAAAMVLVCVVVFLAGMKAADLSKNTVDDGYTKISEYGNIKVYLHENNDEDIAELYLEDLETLPDRLTENCENIYFTDENLTKKFGLEDEIQSEIVAISSGRDIYISTKYHGKEVLVHELWHVFDYANDWISDTDEFVNLYEMYKDEYEVSPGNVQNRYEFFASYGETFYLRKDTLLDNTLFAFFDNFEIDDC